MSITDPSFRPLLQDAINVAVEKHRPDNSILLDDVGADGIHTLRLRVGERISDLFRVCKYDLLILEDPEPLINRIFSKLKETL